MGVIVVDTGKDWTKTGKWLRGLQKDFPSTALLQRFGQMGVESLYEYTPKRTGKTAASWNYEIVHEQDGIVLYWTNSNIVWQDNEKVSVAVLIQNGHATPRGNWVAGRDYITPALEPVLKKMNEELSKEALGL